jgi:hypothetical protein
MYPLWSCLLQTKVQIDGGGGERTKLWNQILNTREQIKGHYLIDFANQCFVVFIIPFLKSSWICLPTKCNIQWKKRNSHDLFLGAHISTARIAIAWKNCSTVLSSCHFFAICLNMVNPIRAVFKVHVEQLISCQKCRAIAIQAIHPHSDFCVLGSKSKN